MSAPDPMACELGGNALAERLRRARLWARATSDHRLPGVSRDLAQALVNLTYTRDFEWALIRLTSDNVADPRPPKANDVELSRMAAAIELAGDIARLIQKADEFQPHLVRNGEAAR